MHHLKIVEQINGTFVDYANFINIAMLIEYSDNYSDTSGSLWCFKRDEVANNANVANNDNAPSFKYKANLIGDTEADGTKQRIKVAILLKYLSNFWRSLEIPLINCKVELSLKWIGNCVLTTAKLDANADATGATFKITDAKFYALVVTLSAEGNVKLVKQLDEGFKRRIYWNKYKVINNKVLEIAAANAEKSIKEWLDSSYQGVKKWFVLPYDNTSGNDQISVDSFKKYFLARVKIKNYTTLKLMEEAFMINQLMNRLSNTMKSEKYPQDKVMITRLVAC